MDKMVRPRGEKKSVSHLEDLQKLVGSKSGRMGKTAKAIFTPGFRTENLVDRTRPKPARRRDNVNINADI